MGGPAYSEKALGGRGDEESLGGDKESLGEGEHPLTGAGHSTSHAACQPGASLGTVAGGKETAVAEGGLAG